jgi:MFS family permease
VFPSSLSWIFFTNISCIVQKWISVLLGVFGAANMAVSRKSQVPFLLHNLILATAIVIAEHLIDRMDTRRASLLFGLCTLIGSTAMFCFATTPTVLVVARALQGASSTVLEIASLALLSDTMGASTTGAAMGWQSVGRFFGIILGPSLSGVVFDLYGHFAVLEWYF